MSQPLPEFAASRWSVISDLCLPLPSSSSDRPSSAATPISGTNQPFAILYSPSSLL